MASMEIYRDIEGYEGKYQITSWGRVYSVDKEKFLRQEETEKGYLRVDLFDDYGKRKHHKVHRLVAMAFIPNPDNKPQVNHKDGNKKNNSITNLEWVTDEENKEHCSMCEGYAKKCAETMRELMDGFGFGEGFRLGGD